MTRHNTTAIVILFALIAASAIAQVSGSGTITGTVTDPSAAAVPGASVTIRNTDTGIERKIDTNEAGNYVAAFLQPGPYEVQATKAGFAGVLRKDLILQVGQTLALDFAMTVKAAQETVEVTGESPVVDPEKTDVSQVVSADGGENLPISGRRWDTFVLLTPECHDGRYQRPGFLPRHLGPLQLQHRGWRQQQPGAVFRSARPRAISGAYVYSHGFHPGVPGEHQQLFSAELGQAAGGVVNAVTKSGTNGFHGDLFYYLRYPTWNALDPLPKSQGNLHPADPSMATVRRQRGRSDHQRQAVLLRHV